MKPDDRMTAGSTSEGGGELTETSGSGATDSSATATSPSTGTTGADSTATDSTATGPMPGCGNDVVELDEECDGLEFAGSSCESLGFDGGELACTDTCAYDTTACGDLPAAPVLELAFSPVKQFDFSWSVVAGAEHYELLESAAPGEPFVQLGGEIVGESISLAMSLHFRFAASYVLRACNAIGCVESTVVDVTGSLAEAVGYFKASNTGALDLFGNSVALSADGGTLAVGAPYEDSNATGIDGDQANDSAVNSGAVYVFVRDAMGGWSQQAYVKPSNTDPDGAFGYEVALSSDGNTLGVGASGTNNTGSAYVFVRDMAGGWSQQAELLASNPASEDQFGISVALSGDGDTFVVGASYEDSDSLGVGGDETNNYAAQAGAVYVFVRNLAGVWSQQAYVKASTTDVGDNFGYALALSDDGDTLGVSAVLEDSAAVGVGPDLDDGTASNAGAVYVFVRDAADQWLQQAYVKASNTGMDDEFGYDIALSGDGDTLAVGAIQEDGNANGIGGPSNELATDAGAAYVFARDGMGQWSQQAYVKATTSGVQDYFGTSVALSSDGSVLVVGAVGDDSDAAGIAGDQTDGSIAQAGAAHVYLRDGAGVWTAGAYVKASNPGPNDSFGRSLTLSSDASTLAIGAFYESSNATGVGGNQANDADTQAGAVYLY